MGIFYLFLFILIILQIKFAITIKLAVRKLEKNQITQELAENFLKKIKSVWWVPYTTKYFNLMRKGYTLIYVSQEVSEETKKKLRSMMKFRLVKGI
ncbi:hypothetical protein [Bacillus sp. AFS040349]|uniref:hypothetical protein n=1 Tax=Bacillus sp. AFS040349 TaxID=2033502 RepID=UPI000BFE871D|nr:hypothetical protein [Bacillus sp. AFS040349]PGT81528.1 hypothetical protein COD11_16995 [Bacillus sp. AFS040349]